MGPELCPTHLSGEPAGQLGLYVRSSRERSGLESRTGEPTNGMGLKTSAQGGYHGDREGKGTSQAGPSSEHRADLRAGSRRPPSAWGSGQLSWWPRAAQGPLGPRNKAVTRGLHTSEASCVTKAAFSGKRRRQWAGWPEQALRHRVPPGRFPKLLSALDPP